MVQGHAAAAKRQRTYGLRRPEDERDVAGARARDWELPLLGRRALLGLLLAEGRDRVVDGRALRDWRESLLPALGRLLGRLRSNCGSARRGDVGARGSTRRGCSAGCLADRSG